MTDTINKCIYSTYLDVLQHLYLIKKYIGILITTADNIQRAT